MARMARMIAGLMLIAGTACALHLHWHKPRDLAACRVIPGTDRLEAGPTRENDRQDAGPTQEDRQTADAIVEELIEGSRE